jgi:predicted RecA/RadA family phage recombinase
VATAQAAPAKAVAALVAVTAAVGAHPMVLAGELVAVAIAEAEATQTAT